MYLKIIRLVAIVMKKTRGLRIMFFKMLMGEDNNMHIVSSLAHKWKEREGGQEGRRERRREGSCPKVEEPKEQFLLSRQRWFSEGGDSEYFKCYRDDKDDELIKFYNEEVMVNFKRTISI